MNDAILHRGPDEDGVYYDNEQIFTVALGIRRLSIIDLLTGKQPIISEDGNKIIVFNGEIYNFKTLKEELRQQAFTFKTNSDTEVILKLYEKEDVGAFSRLDGMFAFSIYDKSTQKIYIARDFFGEKPLYYTQTQDSIIWSSELKSINIMLKSKPKINKTALNLYFQLTYIPSPYTIYEGIYKLEPNHFMTIDVTNNKFDIQEINQSLQKYEPLSKIQATRQVHDMVIESVRSRSISDVPIGTFLSGGVDSSIVSLCLSLNSSQKINTFSIGFEKKSFDETDKQQKVAKIIGSNHHQFILREQDLSLSLHEILNNFDEPFADSSALPSFVVAQKTRKHVKVALTGDGGDEVFGGYNKYYMGKLNKRLTAIIPEKFHQTLITVLSIILNQKNDDRGLYFKINRLLRSLNYKDDFYYNIISLGFYKNDLKTYLKESYFLESQLNYYKNKLGNRNSTLHDFRNIDRLLSLEGDMLVKVDRTSMLTSLECRTPFLNKELWNFSSQLPENYLIKGWDKKHILKEAFKNYFPNGFLNKSKKGFGLPVGDWLRSFLKKELLSYVELSFLKKQDIFQIEPIIKLVYDHIEARVDNTFSVWTFYCFQKWYVNNSD